MHCKVKDGKVIAYPYDFRRLASDHKNMVFSAHPTLAELAEFGVYRVHKAGIEPHDATTHKAVTADKPTLVDGKWTIVSTIVALSAEEVAERDAEQAEEVRERRDALLADSDWTQGNDTPLDNVARQAWASYRQALRDITSQDGFPRSVTWPTKP